MNSLLAPKKGKVANPVGSQCFYCKRVFKNHQALSGHLRIHQEEINSNGSSSYRNSITSSESFSMRDPQNFSAPPWSNPSTVFSKTPSPLDFSMRFYSNENRGMNVSKFYEKGTSVMPPEFSSSSGCAEVQNSKPLPLIAPAPPGGVVPTGVPLSPPFFMVPYEVFQFNTDQFHYPRDSMPSCSAKVLPYLRDQNYGMNPYLMNAVTEHLPGLSSNQSPGFKEPISGQGDIGRYKTQTVLTSGKRRKVGEARPTEMINAFKRPKMNSQLSMETDEPPKRELLLFKDVENRFSGLGISSYAEEDDQTNLDVSLHL